MEGLPFGWALVEIWWAYNNDMRDGRWMNKHSMIRGSISEGRNERVRQSHQAIGCKYGILFVKIPAVRCPPKCKWIYVWLRYYILLELALCCQVYHFIILDLGWFVSGTGVKYLKLQLAKSPLLWHFRTSNNSQGLGRWIKIMKYVWSL